MHEEEGWNHAETYERQRHNYVIIDLNASYLYYNRLSTNNAYEHNNMPMTRNMSYRKRL